MTMEVKPRKWSEADLDNLVQIFARPFSTNLKSQRVLEKAGLKLEATLKRASFKNGEFMDKLRYAKLR